MGQHSDSPEGRTDDWTSCDGENRAHPDSWDDPDIAEPWEPAPDVEQDLEQEERR